MGDISISCTECGSTDVNMVSDAVVTHKPERCNWWGQCHEVELTLRCDRCQTDFVLQISGYKNRVTIATERREAHAQ